MPGLTCKYIEKLKIEHPIIYEQMVKMYKLNVEHDRQIIYQNYDMFAIWLHLRGVNPILEDN